MRIIIVTLNLNKIPNYVREARKRKGLEEAFCDTRPFHVAPLLLTKGSMLKLTLQLYFTFFFSTLLISHASYIIQTIESKWHKHLKNLQNMSKYLVF